MEENRRFSWSDLFIKVILVIIFILFTVWLLSLSNKELSNSLNVLTDNIFSENVEKMKNVGKEYFTIERLPEKVGDVKTLTLEEMYEKKLLLELKDKYGNACSEEDSYVSIEKHNNEYQMKVNLECGSEKEYIIVIMGCYDYCDTDICELKEDVKQIEYQYKKTTGGYWTDYGKWSEWSKTSVSKTNYRQVETKKENEKYSYDKTITETVYEDFEVSCPDGYKLTSDKTKCYKENEKTVPVDPVCPNKSGYTVTRDGFICNYKKNVEKDTATPICPNKSGYTVTRDGFTCNYKKNVESSDYTLKYVSTKTGSSVPKDTSKYEYVEIDSDYVYDCDNSCAFKWVFTYKVYKKVYKTTTKTTTSTATCPSSSYKKVDGKCVLYETSTKTENAICSNGYTQSGNSCTKIVNDLDYKNLVMICPKDYKKTEDGTQCFKEVNSTVKVEGTKEVTYYRYRVREYKGGTTDYKWSTSKEDKKLLDAGYKLTGKTR
ncbi:MAG: hypothetical protein IJE89_03790 [Bacilli bacterium]|nr:hypothetical protein [Bacilli bacterium]